ncbi:MAG: hypothetical protein ACI4R9_06810 [Kiritimatiellia bacterium]
MKDRAAKPSVLASLARIFTRNWGLKLLSLALAILLYCALRPTHSEGTPRSDRPSDAAMAPARSNAAQK